MPRKKDVWSSIVKNLKSSLSKSEFDIWISNTALKNLDKDQALIQVPNRFVATWLHDNYLPQIQDSFKNNLDFLPEIRFTYTDAQAETDTQHRGHGTHSRMGTASWLNPLLTFSTFIQANSNHFAYASALHVARKPAIDYNPLYIFCEFSLGKTHLLNAIGNRIINTNPMTNVRYVPADRFSSDFLTAKRDGKFPKFRKEYRNLDLLLVDDIHLLAGSEGPQRELIFCFNEFYESKKQMVFSGPSPPIQIKNLVPKLTSRFEWGLLAEIKIPGQETITKIIRQKAKGKGFRLPEDVAFFLANRTNDLKTLEQQLSDLQAHASLYQRKINMSTAKTITSKVNTHETPVKDIQRAIVAHFNISLSQLLSDQKKRRFSYPRHLGMYLSRRLTGLSLKEIGDAFGKKDHSTVLYAVRRMEKHVKEEKSPVLDDMNQILKRIS